MSQGDDCFNFLAKFWLSLNNFLVIANFFSFIARETTKLKTFYSGKRVELSGLSPNYKILH